MGGLLLSVSNALAAALTCFVPTGFIPVGVDLPSGSGSLVTAPRDVVSTSVYVLFTLALLRNPGPQSRASRFPP